MDYDSKSKAQTFSKVNMLHFNTIMATCSKQLDLGERLRDGDEKKKKLSTLQKYLLTYVRIREKRDSNNFLKAYNGSSGT